MLTITTKSYVLTASGERATLIDTDVVFHPSGFPFIPGRRIKGLLRESLMEIMEYKGLNKGENILNKLFGREGNAYQSGGCLHIDNAYLKDWGSIKSDLELLGGDDEWADFIKEYFTTEIAQTTIGQDGIAKDGSLRNYRVLKPHLTFESRIGTTAKLDEVQLELLRLAALNLRYVGTRRNRGFGKVVCKLDEVNELSGNSDASKPLSDSVQTFKSLEVELTALQPLVMSALGGDQSTVSTNLYIQGSSLRGALINAYMTRLKRSAKDLDNDDLFYELFLSGNIQFPFLTFEGAEPVPQHLHHVKDRKELVLDVFSKALDDDRTTKPFRSWGKLVGNQYLQVTPKTTSSFHTRRTDRKAGRSTDDTGAIFYYDALAEGQVFKGRISGNPDTLKRLLEVLGREVKARMGKSKSAQYGAVSIAFKPDEGDVETKLTPGEYYMHLLTPLILQDDNGRYVADVGLLGNYLPDGCTFAGKSATSYCVVEHYNSIWEAKTDKIHAFKEGAVFQVSISKEMNMPSAFGEHIELGYGAAKFLPVGQSRLVSENEKERKNGVNNANEKNEFPFTSAVMQSIQEQKNSQEKLLNLKTLALTLAQKKKGKLNNHQVSRMLALIESVETEKLNDALEKVEKWIESAKKSTKEEGQERGKEKQKKEWIESARKSTKEKGQEKGKEKQKRPKPIYEALRKAGLNEALFNCKFIDKQGGTNVDTLQYTTFWKTFFQALRKLNKSRLS